MLYTSIFAALGSGIAAMWCFSMKRRSVLLVCIVLAVYAVYEFFMFKRVLCSGECNIRVDLLLIYPVLLIWLVKCFLSEWKYFSNKK